MQIIEMTRNTMKRRGYDGRDRRAPRLTTVAKVSYGLLLKIVPVQISALNIQSFG